MDHFATTQAGLIARARSGAPEALADLCRAYWRPLYVYFRARGWRSEDAEELTQQLCASLVVSGALATYDPEQGRFRRWLRGAARHLMLNDLKRARALKHGGGWTRIDIDVGPAEQSFQMELQSGLGADEMFDRCWAETVAARVLARVRADCEQDGKGAAYERFAAFVLGDEAEQETAGDRTASRKSPGALRVERHRLTKRMEPRCLRYLREEIATTVASTDAIDDEIRVLFEALEVLFDAPR